MNSAPIDPIDPNNIFNLPKASPGFHYRGQTAVYDPAARKYSQLCCFFTPDQEKLPKAAKYNHMYSIIEDSINDKVYAKCLLCKDLGKDANHQNLTWTDSTDKTKKKPDLGNYWSHAMNFHLHEFSETDIKKFYDTKVGAKVQAKSQSQPQHPIVASFNKASNESQAIDSVC